MRYLFIISLFLMNSFWLKSQSEEEYNGYRIYLSDPKVISSKKKAFKIKFRLTNTGSKSLEKGNKSEYENQLIVKLDEELQNTSVAQYTDLIRQQLEDGKYQLNSGQSELTELKIKIPKERRGQEVFTVNTKGGSSMGFNRKLCPDLVLDSLGLVKKDKKYVYIEFKVKNIGKGAINIIGDKKEEADNILMGAYFSGSPRFSRGAIPADHMYLTGLEETKGILFPGQVIEGKMKISRKKQTKYNKVLIIYVDSNQIVIECNETNNRDHLLVK